MIDIDALKRDKRPQSSTLVHALIDRLEAAEKDVAIKEEVIDSLATVIKRLDAQCDAAEKERDDLRAENAALVDDMNLLRDNNTALRAKIEAMERQVPVGCVESLFDDVVIIHNNFDRAAPVYLAPGAQPQLNEIKIALQRALELGARETWTGARKHRSWEDQREEQQCWNKVWSLLGAQGEEK